MNSPEPCLRCRGDRSNRFESGKVFSWLFILPQITRKLAIVNRDDLGLSDREQIITIAPQGIMEFTPGLGFLTAEIDSFHQKPAEKSADC